MKIFDVTNAKSLIVDGSHISRLYIDNVLIWHNSTELNQSAIAGIAIAGIAIAGME